MTKERTTLSFDFTTKAPEAKVERVERAAEAPSAASPPASPPPASSPAPSHVPPAPKPAEPRPFTVAELDRVIKRTVEGGFSQSVWVEGEVVGARAAPTGHVYLCLKDEKEDASIDVVLYKTSLTQRSRALLVDGARVRLRGRPTFWAPRGRLQFVADRADAVGKGALLEALEALKTKLAAEGLFALDRKRALPADARVVGVVTSARGAVIHDVCKVAFRRGGARILLSAAQVQGAGAADSIRRALLLLQRVAEVDVIILGRGGGSSDELSAFNDEALVRAVAACPVPIVSAVGHEVDVTLTDFAADARAATPSQAAEMVVPDARARVAALGHAGQRLRRAMIARVTERRLELGELKRTLGDPRLAIASFQQTLDDNGARLEASTRRVVARRREALSAAQHRLAFVHPRAVITRERTAFVRLGDRLGAALRESLEKRRATFANAGARLDALSPLKVLSRGYAIAVTGDGRAIRGADDVRAGDRVHVRVESARIEADVVSVSPLPRGEPE
jgi:exodeoxyribonuclease VII large subunit